jgi:predicted alpha/beta-hydrolase family hydrolase
MERTVGFGAVNFANTFHAQSEHPLIQTGRTATRRSVGRLIEELQVAARVENVEVLLVLAGPVKVRAKPRPAAHHLPELRLRPHRLEERQVHDLRHMPTGRISHT